MASSVHAVFALPELFEMVMIHVDMKTLLLSQRVSTRFRDSIITSPRLLRKLWLLPQKVNPELPPPKRMLNPLLYDKRLRLRLKDLFLWPSKKPAIDVHFHTLEGARRLPATGSWAGMILVQPHAPEAVFEMAYHSGPVFRRQSPSGRTAKHQRARAMTYLYPPTMGELRDDLVEKFEMEIEWALRKDVYDESAAKVAR